MTEESVYRFIVRQSEKQPGLPYRFQNPLAGKTDVSHILWGEKLFFPIRERLAKELVDLVIPCLQNCVPSEELLQMLNKRPLFLYLSDLNRRLKLLLDEGIIVPGQLYAFGMQLATNSNVVGAVKLGMIILGYFENDVSTRILRTLGLHNGLTLYAIEASRNFRKRNQFTFDLVRNTTDYGKLIALQDLEPIHVDQREWVFNFGAINHVAANLSAIICLEKVDMAAYYHELQLTEESFSRLSYILAYAGEESPIQNFVQSLLLVDKYIKAAEVYARTFIDLAALIVIGRSMSISGEKDQEGNGWTCEKEQQVNNICRKITRQPRWAHIAALEVAEPQHKTSLIVLVLKEMQLTPDFRELVPLLQRDPFALDMLKFILIDNTATYLDAASEYLDLLLPDEVVKENPLNISEDEITPLYKPDIWLLYLLKALRREKRYEESLFIKCLTCRFPGVRTEAARCLRAAFSQWSEHVVPALEHACMLEPVAKLEDRLQRMLDKARGDGKERRYLDVSIILVKPSPSDMPILNTQIAGAFHRDLTVVDGELATGDILYLLREPKNRYDNQAILVLTSSGYVLGYVPRINNAIPAALMDGGEKLYAVLGRFDIGQSAFEIQIRMHKNTEKPSAGSRQVLYPLESFESVNR